MEIEDILKAGGFEFDETQLCEGAAFKAASELAEHWSNLLNDIDDGRGE